MTQDLTSGMQYQYDAGNMLKTVGSITYWYDNDGQRYIKWNNGVPVKSYFYGSDGEILAEGSGGSVLTAEYIFFNGKRIARVDLPGNAVHYYLSDALNTTSMEVSSAGVIENESDYYPWGGELKFTAKDPANQYKFTGKERDTETGLDYFGARYYSNGLGRFSTPDWAAKAAAVPYAEFADPQSLNLYSYVRNVPTTRYDADGHKDQPDTNKGPAPNPQPSPSSTPAAQKQNPQPPGNQTSAHKGAFVGLTGGATAALGVGKAGAAATGSVAGVVMYDSQNKKGSAGADASGGAVATAGSHTVGAPTQPRSSTAIGAFAGAGGGITFGNAGNMQALRDMTTTLSFDVAFDVGGSIQLSGNAKEGTWAISITIGPGFGLSATQVDTATVGAATNNDRR